MVIIDASVPEFANQYQHQYQIKYSVQYETSTSTTQVLSVPGTRTSTTNIDFEIFEIKISFFQSVGNSNLEQFWIFEFEIEI